MKKIVIFVHGEISPEFRENGFLHKKYARRSNKRIVWELFYGYIYSQSENMHILQKKLENADIFLCDSNNTLEDEKKEINFHETNFNNLIDSLKKIKESQPRLKIFIKNLPFTSKGKIEKLSLYGKLINFWFDEKVLADLK